MKLLNKPEISKAIRKLNRNKTIRQGYFDQLVFAYSEAEQTLWELEEALKGNILKVQGRVPQPDHKFLEEFLRGEE